MTAPGREAARAGTFRLRAYHLLALVPAIGLLGGVPFANGIRTLVFGLPFLLFWIVLWVILTAATMGVLYAIDRRRQPDAVLPDAERGA